ncbi:MAG: type II toxin-antitoxin system VapC family toxin [Candidatus Aenigmarchaeota archaeon]|nr:type II toxin-antitoxin system VapC family toxin [Candidatus Aenigmarchaeota archaeon]
MIYLDTNVIIYAIENNEKYGKHCKQVLLEVESGKLKAYSSVIVLVECINVLKKLNRILAKEGKKELVIRDNVDAILSLPIVWLDLNFLVIKRASEYDFDVSGIDCIHIASMEMNSLSKIISADEDFDKVDFAKRIDPLDYKS